MTHVSLFSGLAGLDLAAEWAGFKTVLFVEKDLYCQKVLARHWPGVPIIDDIRSVNRASIDGAIDVISGGFPCQAHSTASRGRRTAEDLSGEFVRVVSDIRPRFAIGENVGERIIRAVAEQLRAIGYGAAVYCNRAFDYGADHLRYRWWAIAYPNDEGELPGRLNAEMAIVPPVQDPDRAAQNMARAFRTADGIPARVERLKALGNAVVPAQAYPIFRAIAQVEKGENHER